MKTIKKQKCLKLRNKKLKSIYITITLKSSFLHIIKTRGRNKIGKRAWVYPHARELYSKDVEGHGTEAMAQPKSREHWLFDQPPGGF